MQAIVQEMTSGSVSWVSASLLCSIALVLGAAGGALGGMLVGGKHIGYGLSAMMGTFFGPIAALPGVLVALLVLFLV
jgi:hypothetical protein